MSETGHDELERKLAAMTRWEGEPPELWRKALEAGADEPRRASGRRRTGPALRLAATIVVGILAVGAVIMLLEPIGRARDDPSVEHGRPPVPSPPNARRLGTPTALIAETWPAEGVGGFVNGAPAQIPARASDADRQVVRKATMELVTPDVEAAFLKATQIPSAARGEFIESSRLTGSGKEARANLTLRVDADRLGETLTALRALGSVQAEELQGEDVTGQVVDLEARLRNEQRVETELLELLQSRGDAPLEDILELRRRIGQVRESIERLAAQREHLRHLVSLASILVIIRADEAPEDDESGLDEYFRQSLGTAWTSGLRYLTDTLAGGVRVLLGGLLFWVAIAAGLVIWRNRRAARAAQLG